MVGGEVCSPKRAFQDSEGREEKEKKREEDEKKRREKTRKKGKYRKMRKGEGGGLKKKRKKDGLIDSLFFVRFTCLANGGQNYTYILMVSYITNIGPCRTCRQNCGNYHPSKGGQHIGP